MKYKLLSELLPLLEAYEESSDEASVSVADFLDWTRVRDRNKGKEDMDKPQLGQPMGDTNAQISQLIVLLHKYVKNYFRKSFRGLPLVSMDDFGFLATLFTFGALRKHELIKYNTINTPSGMEIIKRLEQATLIESKSDPEDGRAKLVSLTEKGKGLFFQLFPKLQELGTLATGKLSESEKETLLDLLRRLNDFHQPIFHQEQDRSVPEILALYLHKQA